MFKQLKYFNVSIIDGMLFDIFPECICKLLIIVSPR